MVKIEDWTPAEVIRWIMQLYMKVGKCYERLNLHLLKNCTGIQFLKTTELELRDVDSINSKWLSGKIEELARSNNRNLNPFENACTFNLNDSSGVTRNSSRLGHVSTNGKHFWKK